MKRTLLGTAFLRKLCNCINVDQSVHLLVIREQEKLNAKLKTTVIIADV